MADLTDAATKIVEENKNAGHGWSAVWAALHYVHEAGSVNEGLGDLWEMHGRRSPPRWLVVRWARMAGLIEDDPKRPA